MRCRPGHGPSAGCAALTRRGGPPGPRIALTPSKGPTAFRRSPSRGTGPAVGRHGEERPHQRSWHRPGDAHRGQGGGACPLVASDREQDERCPVARHSQARGGLASLCADRDHGSTVRARTCRPEASCPEPGAAPAHPLHGPWRRGSLLCVDGPLVSAYEEASGFLVAAAGLVPQGAWGRPALGEWTVRELVGHANRAHLLIEEYLLRPVAEEPPDAVYWSPQSIAARGRAAVVLLGDDPLGAVRAAGASAVRRVRSTSGDAFLGSPARHQTLAEYLPSRVAELTVHTLDLVRALGLGLAAPSGALAVSLQEVMGRALSRGQGEQVLMAVCGRGTLPTGFSVY